MVDGKASGPYVRTLEPIQSPLFAGDDCRDRADLGTH